MTINSQKLKGKIIENGYTIETFSKKLGINRNTLSFYLKNPNNFRYGTILKTVRTLNLNHKEASEIFFAN